MDEEEKQDGDEDDFTPAGREIGFQAYKRPSPIKPRDFDFVSVPKGAGWDAWKVGFAL